MARTMPKIDFKNPDTRNLAIAIGIGIAVIIGWYYFWYMGTSVQLSDLETSRLQKQNELNSILAMKPQLENLRKDTSLARIQLDSLKSIFPDQKEIPKLIREMARLARESDVQPRKLSPMPDSAREYYIENHYSVAISGGFHQIATYFAALANLPLMINLSIVNLVTNPRSKQQGANNESSEEAGYTVNATFRLTTFSSRK